MVPYSRNKEQDHQVLQGMNTLDFDPPNLPCFLPNEPVIRLHQCPGAVSPSSLLFHECDTNIRFVISSNGKTKDCNVDMWGGRERDPEKD